MTILFKFVQIVYVLMMWFNPVRVIFNGFSQIWQKFTSKWDQGSRDVKLILRVVFASLYRMYDIQTIF